MTSTSAPPREIVWDDFRDGFATDGPDARWAYSGAGPYVANDGVVTTSERGLRVVSGGTNPRTGEPAFALTLGPESGGGPGLPGGFDHAKWFAFATHEASAGGRGFDAVPGYVLSFAAGLSGRVYGHEGHPFGSAVADPDRDLRLAAATMNVVDPDSMVVFDFFLANRQVYAFYERLPFLRGQLGNYAAFSYAVPVADRTPDTEHQLAISYDRAAGSVTWHVDGSEVFRVDRVGHHLPSREHLAIDHGGEPADVRPRQLNCGMGLLSLLDARLPGLPALVRLSSVPDFYFDPAVGPPAPQSFVDDESRDGSRLFGQGAELTLSRYVVSNLPAADR